MRPTLRIDGNNFSDFEGLVREFNPAVFGDDRTWYGSLDQLNDCLRGGFGAPEGYFTIEWLNSHKSRKRISGKKPRLPGSKQQKIRFIQQVEKIGQCRSR